MEEIQQDLLAAKESGDLDKIKETLLRAKAAGGGGTDPATIDQALKDVDTAIAGADPGANARKRAEESKLKGNASLKEGTKSGAREARDHFTAGLAANCSDSVLNAQLHGNRAHVRIQLRQFVEAVDDCRKAIDLDPSNLKHYWRAAKASMHLDLWQSGIDFCNQGLEQKDDADLAKLRATCMDKLLAQQQRKTELISREFNAEEAMALQERVNSLSGQVDILKSQVASRQREGQRTELTRKVVHELPESAPLYNAVGRCFIREDQAKIKESLQKQVDHLEEEVPKLQKSLTELEKRKESAEKELMEMMTASQRGKGVGFPLHGTNEFHS